MRSSTAEEHRIVHPLKLRIGDKILLIISSPFIRLEFNRSHIKQDDTEDSRKCVGLRELPTKGKRHYKTTINQTFKTRGRE